MRKQLANFKFIKLTGFGVAFFVAIPALIIAAALLVTNYMNIRGNKDLLQGTYLTALNWIAQKGEQDIEGVVNSLKGLGTDDILLYAMKYDVDRGNTEEVRKISARLKEFSDAQPMVRDCVILDNQTRYVISKDGIYDYSGYFIKESVYNDYSAPYWQNVRYYVLDEYKTLSPTERTTQYGTENIMPMVVSKIREYDTKKLLLVNLRMDAVIKEAPGELFTPNSSLYYINRRTGKMFDINGEKPPEAMPESEIYERIVSGETFFDYTLNGKNYFIVSSAIGNNLVGYTYFATIPYSDINKVQRGMVISVLLICAIFILAAVLVFFGSVRGIMNPIRQIAIKFGIFEDKSLVEKINRACEKMLSEREMMMNVLPAAQERYLINYLNSAEYNMDRNTRDAIKTTLPFNKKYFAAAAVRMMPNDAFYEIYSVKDYYNIMDSFYALVKEEFSEKLDAFFVHLENDMVYIILNFDYPDAEEDISAVIENIKSYLQNDAEIIDLYIGTSRVYASVEDIKRACEEAVLEMKIVFKKIDFEFGKRGKTRENIHDLDENKLFRALAAGKTDEGVELIREAVEEDGEDARIKKQKYLRALNTVLKVCKTKQIQDDGRMDYEIYSDAVNKSPEEIYRMVLNMINSISTYAAKKGTKIDSDLVVEYIHKNYTDTELSLKKLADIFCTKENYLSTLIKNKTGIGFKEYVLNLRIDEAKRLLSETNKSIQEIYEETGYVSKQSFFRSFKSVVGVTPGDYRKNNK